MKCSAVLVCMLCITYMYPQSTIQSWAGNVANVGVNCPVIIIGDQCPPWVNPTNAQGTPDEVFSTNTQILTSLGTDSLRAGTFGFGAPDPMIDPFDITGGRVNILFDQNAVLLTLGLLSGSEVDIIYTNVSEPGLNRTFSLIGSSLLDVNLLGIDLTLLSAEANSGDLTGLTVEDIKNGSWQVNFRMDGLSISIVSVLSVDAIELQFDYETPLFLDLLSQEYTLQNENLLIRWQLPEPYENTDFFVEQLRDKSWEYIAPLVNNGEILQYKDPYFAQATNYYRLCALDLSGNRKCFPPLFVKNPFAAKNQVYPNPVHQRETLRINGIGALYKVEAVSINGSIQPLSFKFQNELCEIDAYSLPAGLVLIRLYETPEIISYHRVLVYH